MYSESQLRDFINRTSAENALSEDERSLRLIVDSIPGLVALLTADGEVEVVNNQALEYFGKTPEELKGWATSDLIHPDGLAAVIAAWKHSVETGDPYEIDHRLRQNTQGSGYL
jgi:PAS domain S-box-containing protein